jgi:hypothetical protein
VLCLRTRSTTLPSRSWPHYNGRVKGPEQSASTGWLADTHAHLYACYGVLPYLESTLANVDRSRPLSGAGATGTGCLMIAETTADRSFSRLVQSGRDRFGRLSVQTTSERESVVVSGDAGETLVLVGGKQVVTAEGLEVLVFGGSGGAVEDGWSADRVLDRAAATDSLAIVPWGFGKWWFGRGAVIRRLVKEHAATVALGDNGGRPAGAPAPGVFRLAAQRGVPVLAGSDPLPLPSEAGRAGSYGVIIPCAPDFERPAAQIISLLRARPAAARKFGHRVSPLRFAALQVLLRVGRAVPHAERASVPGNAHAADADR